MPGDDEQRIVDADSQPDHRRQGGRRRRHVDDRRDERDESDAGGQAQQGGADGQAHRDHRSERQQEHDHGRQQADELLAHGRRVGGIGGKVAAQFHLHGTAGVGCVGSCLQALECVVTDLARRLAVLHVGKGDAAVDGALQLADRSDIGLSRDIGKRRVDGRGRGGVRQRAGINGEHQLGRRPSDRRKALLEHVESSLGLHTGDVERVAGLAADRGAGPEGGDGDQQPGDDDEATVAHRSAPEPVEERSHFADVLAGRLIECRCVSGGCDLAEIDRDGEGSVRAWRSALRAIRSLSRVG